MADFDYQKMNDYVTADPEVAELREKRNATRRKIEELKDSARRHVEKMHGLYLAKTAVCEKMQIEPCDDENDFLLERITGQCGECWDDDWKTAAEVVFDGQLSCSIAIANLAKQIYKLIEDINIMSSCVQRLEDNLRQQFREQFYKEQKKQTTKEVEQ